MYLWDSEPRRARLVVTVADVAAPTGSSPELERQDYFILCDLRPLGLKPKFAYAHLRRLHMPSLLADLGVALPAGHRIKVLGARLSGDVLRVPGSCTVIFYACEEESDSSSSEIVSVPAEPAIASPEPSGPVGSSQDEQTIDTSIPGSHSWNAATTPALTCACCACASC